MIKCLLYHALLRVVFFFSSRRRHTRWPRDWSSDVCSSDLPLDAIDAAYASGVTDEFIEPAIIGDYPGMMDGDGLISANFRADRIRQILDALLDPGFDAFDRSGAPDFAAVLGVDA